MNIAQPQPEIISPAEAKFWREWADKAPGLLRANMEKYEMVPAKVPYRACELAWALPLA